MLHETQLPAAPLFAPYFVTGRFSDATLVLSPLNERVPVHRVVLASQSPFFDSLFSAAPPNSNSNSNSEIVVELPRSTPGEAMRLVLEWLYFGQALVSLRLAFPVLRLASAFDIRPLHVHVEGFLARALAGREVVIENNERISNIVVRSEDEWVNALVAAVKAEAALPLIEAVVKAAVRDIRASDSDSNESSSTQEQTDSFIGYSFLRRVCDHCATLEDPFETDKVMMLLNLISYSDFKVSELEVLQNDVQNQRVPNQIGLSAMMLAVRRRESVSMTTSPKRSENESSQATIMTVTQQETGTVSLAKNVAVKRETSTATIMRTVEAATVEEVEEFHDSVEYRPTSVSPKQSRASNPFSNHVHHLDTTVLEESIPTATELFSTEASASVDFETHKSAENSFDISGDSTGSSDGNKTVIYIGKGPIGVIPHQSTPPPPPPAGPPPPLPDTKPFRYSPEKVVKKSSSATLVNEEVFTQTRSVPQTISNPEVPSRRPQIHHSAAKSDVPVQTPTFVVTAAPEVQQLDNTSVGISDATAFMPIPPPKKKTKRKKNPDTTELLDAVSERLSMLIEAGEVESEAETETDGENTDLSYAEYDDVSFSRSSNHGSKISRPATALSTHSVSNTSNPYVLPAPQNSGLALDLDLDLGWSTDFGKSVLDLTQKSFSSPGMYGKITGVKTPVDVQDQAASFLKKVEERRQSVAESTQENVSIISPSFMEHQQRVNDYRTSEQQRSLGMKMGGRSETYHPQQQSKSYESPKISEAPVPPARKSRYIPSSTTPQEKLERRDPAMDESDRFSFDSNSPQSAKHFNVHPAPVKESVLQLPAAPILTDSFFNESQSFDKSNDSSGKVSSFFEGDARTKILLETQPIENDARYTRKSNVIASSSLDGSKQAAAVGTWSHATKLPTVLGNANSIANKREPSGGTWAHMNASQMTNKIINAVGGSRSNSGNHKTSILPHMPWDHDTSNRTTRASMDASTRPREFNEPPLQPRHSISYPSPHPRRDSFDSDSMDNGFSIENSYYQHQDQSVDTTGYVDLPHSVNESYMDRSMSSMGSKSMSMSWMGLGKKGLKGMNLFGKK
ncbi:hypothetical protein HDU79_008873 [Rhizoclosmatium sp. JEL0117]|nr:hypothetical protein HDU79_008873 [Rhizoclosmatium sp. JEL0117]